MAQPGEVCYVLTANETGAASTENIFPIGTYEVKETKGNAFYQCNTEWSETFTITGEEANPQVSVSCENEMLPAAIRVQKVNPNDEALPGAKFLLEWSEDGTSWKPVTKSETILAGGCSSEGLDDSGCITTDDFGMAVFTGLSPMVQYRISEVATPNGYQLLKEPILVDKLTPEQNYEAAYRVVDNYVFNLPKTGASDFLYLPICIAIPVTRNYSIRLNNVGKEILSHGYRAMRTTKLKEIYIIRYADDFRIFCRTKTEAEKAKIAITQWLYERLRLEISPEKTKIVNVKRRYSDFLGFKIKVHPKGNKHVVQSHISDKQLSSKKTALLEQAKHVAHPRPGKMSMKKFCFTIPWSWVCRTTIKSLPA